MARLPHKKAMMKQAQISRILLACMLSLGLCACQTVRMPKIDIMKSPEFSEEAANISKSYPRASDAPETPDDIRTAGQWDKDARALQKLRTDAGKFAIESGPDSAESKARFDTLKAKAQAYKNDDPKNGPVQGFPDYEPRR